MYVRFTLFVDFFLHDKVKTNFERSNISKNLTAKSFTQLYLFNLKHIQFSNKKIQEQFQLLIICVFFLLFQFNLMLRDYSPILYRCLIKPIKC